MVCFLQSQRNAPNPRTCCLASQPSRLQAGDSPLVMGPKAEVSGKMNTNPLSFLLNLILGTAAGFYYFCREWGS